MQSGHRQWLDNSRLWCAACARRTMYPAGHDCGTIHKGSFIEVWTTSGRRSKHSDFCDTSVGKIGEGTRARKANVQGRGYIWSRLRIRSEVGADGHQIIDFDVTKVDDRVAGRLHDNERAVPRSRRRVIVTGECDHGGVGLRLLVELLRGEIDDERGLEGLEVTVEGDNSPCAWVLDVADHDGDVPVCVDMVT